MSDGPTLSRGRHAFLLLIGLTLFALGVAAGYQLQFHTVDPDPRRTQPVTAPGATPPVVTLPTPAPVGADAQAWQAAEDLFTKGQFAEAKKAYADFQAQFAASRMAKLNAETLRERLAAIEVKLNPPPRPGLIGRYFHGRKFADADLVLERIDPAVDFAWGGEPPAPELPRDDYCVRWFGTLRIDQPGRYTIAAITDDGARVKIDDKLVLEQWVDQGDTRVAGEIDLTAGDHQLVFEYYEHGGGASAKLLWALAGQFEEEIIPTRVLSFDPKQLKYPDARPTLVAPRVNSAPNDEDFF